MGAAAVPIAKVVGTALTGALINKELGPKVSSPDAPKVAPTMDADESKKARMRDMQRKYAKAGRAGTILSDNTTLG